MSAQLAPSAAAIPRSKIRQIAELAMSMDGVYKLYFGESNVPTPDYIKRAAQKALADGYTFYTANAGLPSLRQALARYYSDLHGVTLDPNGEIAVTAAGVQALNAAIRCMLDPGDEGIVLSPAWPNGTGIIQMCNATPREIPYILSGGRYSIDWDALEAAVTPRTRLLIYTSPSNPLGWVATQQDQERLLEFTRRHNLWLLADEVYERIHYPSLTAPVAAKGVPSGAAPSILKLCTREDAVVVVQSFSKAYCMTGWRLGWMVGRRDIIARASLLSEFIVSCASGFVQRAAETALLWGEDTMREMVCRLRENRDFSQGVLSKIQGVTIPQADGAFYLWLRVEGLTDSFQFCKDLLTETKVGLAPGVAFGNGGEGCLRVCYASDRAILEEALPRIKMFLESRR